MDLEIKYQEGNYFDNNSNTIERRYVVNFIAKNIPQGIRGIFYTKDGSVDTLPYSGLTSNTFNMNELVCFDEAVTAVNQLGIWFKKTELDQVETFVEQVKEIISRKHKEYLKQVSILKKFKYDRTERYTYDDNIEV